MARAKINVWSVGLNTVGKNGDTVAVTPVTLDATNNMYVPYPKDGDMFVVTNTSGSADITLTVKANTGNAGDDLIFTIGKSETHIFGNLESARYKQSDGSLYFNPSAATGTIYGISDLI